MRRFLANASLATFRQRLRRTGAPALLVAVLASGSALAQSADAHPAEDIRAAAIAAVGGGSGAEATLDPALRLPQCRQRLQAVASGPRTALVRCPDAPGWRVYVPVQARHEADVVVLAAPALAGVPIAAHQLIVQRRDVSGLRGTAFSDPATLVGRIPATALAAGVVPTGQDFPAGAPLRRGDPVTLVARTGGVEVRMAGRALGPARSDGRIPVENTASRRILRGRVTGPGEVEVLP